MIKNHKNNQNYIKSDKINEKIGNATDFTNLILLNIFKTYKFLYGRFGFNSKLVLCELHLVQKHKRLEF